MREKYDNPKEIVFKVIKDVNEQTVEIKRLNDELRELEKEGEMCNTDRIIEIIDELSILDPYDNESAEEITARSKPAFKPKRKRRLPIMIAAAIILMLLSVQIASAAVGGNFFGSVYEWTRGMFLTLIGTEVNEGNHNVGAFGTREYTSVEELKEYEEVDIVIPHHAKTDHAVYSFYANFHKILVFFSDDSSLVITLSATPETNNDDALHYQSNGIQFHIYEEAKQILWYYGNDSYSFTGNAMMDHKKIIDTIS
ncbi:hypothetical protein FACS1894219_12060 [Clostridia bacterium]|nr:hypothetical protein FACS1894219_12060 [Clostridia bacterium]